MYRLHEKNRLTFSLICIAAYIVLSSVGDSLSDKFGIEKVVTAPMGIVLSLLLIVFIKRNGLSEHYGLCSFKGSMKAFLFFIPLVVLMSANLWNGVQIRMSVLETVLSVISMLCVGLIEEVIFRGFLFKAMCKDNIRAAIIVSGITFGFGHIINLLNGAELVSTLLQLCYASTIGILFAVIFYKGKSIVPCIIAHGVFNALSIFAVEGSELRSMIMSAVVCVLSVGYAIWIWNNSKKVESVAETQN